MNPMSQSPSWPTYWSSALNIRAGLWCSRLSSPHTTSWTMETRWVNVITEPHELGKRGESMSQDLMKWGNEVSQYWYHRTSWTKEMWVVDITRIHELRKWGLLISHDLMKSGYFWHDLRKLVISHKTSYLSWIEHYGFISNKNKVTVEYCQYNCELCTSWTRELRPWSI